MAERVHVVVRFRPRKEKESGEPSVKIVSDTELEALAPTTTTGTRTMTFDRVFSPTSTQEELFAEVGHPTVDNVLRGYNGTVLAYGQTGSGKTHSMMGPGGGNPEALAIGSAMYEARGLIPRIVEQLFVVLTHKDPEEMSFVVTTSVFELYMEGINDLLLAPGAPRQEYRIREDAMSGKGIYVENLAAKECRSVADVYDAMKTGLNHRKVAATMANDTSSRSHCLTCIFVEQIDHTHEDARTSSRLNLVDLAGSEKVAKTQAEGQRLKEAQMINLSLTLLGNVIYKLTDGKSVYIPYRDSKLTRILQESFGGNSRTTLLCQCAMTSSHKDETASTLAFAARAKMIENKPRVNRELGGKELQLAYLKLLEENSNLKERVTQLEGIDRSAVARQENDGLGACEEHDRIIQQLRDEIASLMATLSEMKQEKLDLDALLQDAKNTIEFYKKKHKESESVVKDLKEKLKREQQACASWCRKYNEAVVGKSASSESTANAGGVKRTGSVQRKPSVSGRRRSSVPRATPAEGRRSRPTTSASNNSNDAPPTTPPLAPPQPARENTPSDRTLSSIGENTLNSVPSMTTADFSLLEHELRQKIEDLEKDVEEGKAKNHAAALANARLCAELEDAHLKSDNLMKQLDVAQKKASTAETEVTRLKAIIDSLKQRLSELEESNTKRSNELREREVGLSTERDRLAQLSKRLKEQHAQLEYCEIAEIELIVKSEDIEVTENDLVVIESGVLDEIRLETTVFDCLTTVMKLIDFFEAVLSALRRHPFATPELESRRSNLIGGFAMALDRCNSIKSAVTRILEGDNN